MRPRITDLAKAIAASLVALLGATAAPASAAPPPEPGEFVAYIDKTVPEHTPFADAVRIRRHGEWRQVTEGHYGLVAGDEVFVTQPGTVVVVRILATNQRVPVRKSAQAAGSRPAPDWTVPSEPGLPVAVAAWFMRFLQGAEHTEGQSRIAATRSVDMDTCYNETGKTDDPTPFAIPMLSASGSVLAGGSRAVFVSWHGGAPPFSVSLSKGEGGETVAKTTGVQGICAAYLPRTALLPGNYRLTVTDANHVSKQGNLSVVADPPGIPEELRSATLPEETRQLYAATWLSVLDGGKWVFEAQQRVAAMDCRSAAARDWLRRWHGFADQAQACENAH